MVHQEEDTCEALRNQIGTKDVGMKYDRGVLADIVSCANGSWTHLKKYADGIERVCLRIDASHRTLSQFFKRFSI